MTNLETIAKQAGVSRNTVARALSGDTKATWGSTARRVARIRRIADELGYMPNAAAQATRRGKFNSFALLLSSRENVSSLPVGLLNGIIDAMQSAGLQLSLHKLSDEQLTDAANVPKILTSLSTDGLLINYTDNIPPKMIELIRGHRVPSVWLNSIQPADAVRPDDKSGTRLATRHLASLGHRRIAYIDYAHAAENIDDQHYSATHRATGYREAMDEAGLQPRVQFKRPGMRLHERVNLARELLVGTDRPTAILTYSSGSTAPLVVAAMSLGLTIPEDLSVITTDPDPHNVLGFEFTTLSVPDAEVGRRAVEMLRRKTTSPGTPIEPEAIPFEIVTGGTCAPPRT